MKVSCPNCNFKFHGGSVHAASENGSRTLCGFQRGPSRVAGLPSIIVVAKEGEKVTCINCIRRQFRDKKAKVDGTN